MTEFSATANGDRLKSFFSAAVLNCFIATAVQSSSGSSEGRTIRGD